MNAALLLSGGIGSRAAARIPKQYIRAGEYMIVTYALIPLLSVERIDQVCIVAGKEWQQSILEEADRVGLDTDKIKGFAEPGENRQYSIYHGLQAIQKWNSDKELNSITVLIHDAARPSLSEKLIMDCYAALEEHDGVMPVLPMKDTVYYSSDGRRAEKLLDRSCIFAGQAPELFRLDKYIKANESLLPEKILKVNGSAEPAVLAGMDIVMIPGDETNQKITTDEDLKQFQKRFAI